MLRSILDTIAAIFKKNFVGKKNYLQISGFIIEESLIIFAVQWHQVET